MDSEFQQFLDTLKRLGIRFSINRQPAKQVWQQVIKAAGYCDVSVSNCTVVEVGNTEYLFCNGSLFWEEGRDYGPARLFMLSRDKISNEVRNRTFFNERVSGGWTSVEGWQAAVAKYPDQRWGRLSRK